MSPELESDKGLAEWADARPDSSLAKLRRWRRRWRSGVVRAFERWLGSRSSWEWLVSDFSVIAHLPTVARAIRSVEVLEEACVLDPIRMPPDASVPVPSTVRPPVFITQLNDARCHIASGLVQLPSGHLFMGSDGVLQLGLLAGGAAQEMSELGKASRRLSGSWALAPATPYFYHHLIDTCLPLLKAAQSVPDVRVAVPPGQPGWYYDVLSSLALPWTIVPERAVDVERVVLVDRAPVVPQDVDLLRAHGPTGGGGQPIDVLFLSRRGLPRFDAQSEAQVRDILSPLSVTTLDPASMSFAEQVSAFESARVVVGTHGGALTNLVWSRRARLAVEVFARGFRGLMYARLAQAARIPYVPCTPEDLSGLSAAVAELTQEEPDRF